MASVRCGSRVFGVRSSRRAVEGRRAGVWHGVGAQRGCAAARRGPGPPDVPGAAVSVGGRAGAGHVSRSRGGGGVSRAAATGRASEGGGGGGRYESKVYKVVLTGGPCGGKSTALAMIQERLESIGVAVVCVPEAATVLFTGGVKLDVLKADPVGFQVTLLAMQMANEDTFVELAGRQARANGKPAVVICDRGCMDSKAYVDGASWGKVMEGLGGFNETRLRDRRYDAVVHLVTAADGAEEFYTTENNAARTETAEQARGLDKKVMSCWVGHPNLVICDNSGTFQQKISSAVDAIFKVVGSPPPGVARVRYLLRNDLVGGAEVKGRTMEQWGTDFKTRLEELREDEQIGMVSELYVTEVVYLDPKDPVEGAEWLAQNNVRRRWPLARPEEVLHTHRVWSPKTLGVDEGSGEGSGYTRTEHSLRRKEYARLRKRSAGVGQRKDVPPLRKVALTFEWKNSYYEVNLYASGISTVEVYTQVNQQDPTQSARILMPPFLHPDRNVTDEVAFSTYTLANTVTDEGLIPWMLDEPKFN